MPGSSWPSWPEQRRCSGLPPAHAGKPPPSTVCNLNEKSPRGDFFVSSDHPSQMTVGNARSGGLAKAAEKSPALAPCLPQVRGAGSALYGTGGPF